MATSSITANFYCDDAKAANAFVRMLAQPVRTVVRKKRSLPVVNDATVDDEDAFVKRFKARWPRSRRAEKSADLRKEDRQFATLQSGRR